MMEIPSIKKELAVFSKNEINSGIDLSSQFSRAPISSTD